MDWWPIVKIVWGAVGFAAVSTALFWRIEEPPAPEQQPKHELQKHTRRQHAGHPAGQYLDKLIGLVRIQNLTLLQGFAKRLQQALPLSLRLA